MLEEPSLIKFTELSGGELKRQNQTKFESEESHMAQGIFQEKVVLRGSLEILRIQK